MAGPLAVSVEKTSGNADEVYLVLATEGGGKLHLRLAPAAIQGVRESLELLAPAMAGPTQIAEMIVPKYLHTGVGAGAEAWLEFETVTGRIVRMPIGAAEIGDFQQQLAKLATMIAGLTTKH